jgi:hypothetical protein
MLVLAPLENAGDDLIGEGFGFACEGGPGLIDLGGDVGLGGDDLGVAFFASLGDGGGLLVEELLAPGFLLLVDLSAATRAAAAFSRAPCVSACRSASTFSRGWKRVVFKYQ